MKTVWMLFLSLVMLMAVHVSNADTKVDEWFRRRLAPEIEERTEIETRGKLTANSLSAKFKI